MITEKKIQEVADKIAKEFKPEKIILFGSWAWGKKNPDSDIDLLVVKNMSGRRIDRARRIRRAFWGSKLPMDILVYTPEELKKKIHEDRNLFLEDVFMNGKLLYAKD